MTWFLTGAAIYVATFAAWAAACHARDRRTAHRQAVNDAYAAAVINIAVTTATNEMLRTGEISLARAVDIARSAPCTSADIDAVRHF